MPWLPFVPGMGRAGENACQARVLDAQGDVGPPVGCEWLRHILRAVISVALRVKVRCEGVTGDEV